MKSTGINRPLDELGRIVFPIELRRTLGLSEGDTVEFFYDDEGKRMMLRKYRPQECIFCSSLEELTFYRNQFICASCRLEMRCGFISDNGSENLESSEIPHNQTTEEHDYSTNHRSERKRKVTFEDLVRVIESHPSAPQRKWAEVLGVSQGRVSQMIRQSLLRDMKSKTTVNESLTALESSNSPIKTKRRGKRTEALEKLMETMRTFPNASQTEWAMLLGYSQGYVSQLIRDIDRQGSSLSHSTTVNSKELT